MSTDTRTSHPSATLFVVGAAVGIGLLTFIIASLAGAIGVLSGGTEPDRMLVVAAVLRAILSLGIVFAVIRFAARNRPQLSAIQWILVALAGYALNVFSWTGDALVTTATLGGVEPPLWARVVGVIVDAGIWAAVAFFAARAGSRLPRRTSATGLH